MNTNDLESNKQKKDPLGRFDRSLWRWWGYGIEFIGVLGIFTYAGWWADQRWQTDPWIMITGFFTGFVGMIYLLIKELGHFKK